MRLKQSRILRTTEQEPKLLRTLLQLSFANTIWDYMQATQGHLHDALLYGQCSTRQYALLTKQQTGCPPYHSNQALKVLATFGVRLHAMLSMDGIRYLCKGV